MARPFAWLALLLLVPFATAQGDAGSSLVTLDSFEEPHTGGDGDAWPFTVLQDQTELRIIVFRNAPSRVFGVAVVDDAGKQVYSQNGTRGIQTLPKLEAGKYTFFLRGSGSFQVTDKALQKTVEANVSTTLQGTDAYVLNPPANHCVEFTGDVRVEWWPLIGAPEEVVSPAVKEATAGGAYVMTVRGAEDAPYTIALGPHDERCAVIAETPGLAPFALVAAVAFLALARRR